MGPQQAVVRRPEHVPARQLAPGVTVAELLGDGHGCRGLHQRRLLLTGGATAGVAGGRGEAWYVVGGSGTLDTEAPRTVGLEPGTAVWMRPSLGYRCRAASGQRLEVLAVTVRADATEGDGAAWAGVTEGDGAAIATEDEGPAVRVATLDGCQPERTGDRKFRVLLSSGLTITEFVGLIPPGRAPVHHHSYDEVVHVLAGRGMVHLDGRRVGIGPGTSVYLPPYQPHCLENSGAEPLQVLGVFYPAGSPAAKTGC